MQREDAAVGSRGWQHQRERKVPHDVGLEKQDAPVAMLGKDIRPQA
jgi:hypothetical protein